MSYTELPDIKYPLTATHIKNGVPGSPTECGHGVSITEAIGNGTIRIDGYRIIGFEGVSKFYDAEQDEVFPSVSLVAVKEGDDSGDRYRIWGVSYQPRVRDVVVCNDNQGIAESIARKFRKPYEVVFTNVKARKIRTGPDMPKNLVEKAIRQVTSNATRRASTAEEAKAKVPAIMEKLDKAGELPPETAISRDLLTQGINAAIDIKPKYTRDPDTPKPKRARPRRRNRRTIERWTLGGS